MASSLPVISTDQGAIIESVIDGLNGFIVKSKSPEEIAIKIQILTNDENLRNSMSRKSRELYESNLLKRKWFND